MHVTRAGLLILVCCAGAVHGLDRAFDEIRDDSALRVSLLADWFTDPPARVLARAPVVRQLPSGESVRVRSEPGRDEVLVILARRLNNAYPDTSQGSWVVYRRLSDGQVTKVRIFPRSDPNLYLQFSPLGSDRSQMDLVAYDGYLFRAWPLSLSFDRLLTAPLNTILDAASVSFPRGYLDPDVPAYADLRDLVAGIRQRLPDLAYRDDGAYDENGLPVLIATLQAQTGTAGLNCSGFAKWVVDGVLRPLRGGWLPIAPLKVPVDGRGSSFSIPYEESHDPFFGLDWTRNLALQAALSLGAVRKDGAAAPTLAEIEVRDNPVSMVTIRDPGRTQIKPYANYLADAGFAVEGLRPLLYVQALRDPRHFYLASVNDEQGTSPRLRRHFHVAVLVPHFTATGRFTVSVFESATETTFEDFAARYRGQHVNLVRVGVSGSFDP